MPGRCAWPRSSSPSSSPASGSATWPSAATTRSRASSPRPPRRSRAAPTTSTSSGSPTGLNRPTWVGTAPGDRRALGARAARPRRPRRRRPPHDAARPRRPGQARRRAGPARHRLPPRLRDRPPRLPALVRPQGRHARRGVPRPAATDDRPAAAAPAAVRRPARGEPQRRPARVRPRRPPLPRPRRRRRRVRPRPHRPGPGQPARQDRRRRRRRAAPRVAGRAHRPAQPVAVLVRLRARRAVDRRRRPGRDRGDRPRAARARRAAEEPRLERVRGRASGCPATTSTARGELVWPVATYKHDGRLLGHRRRRLRRLAPAALGRRYVYGDFCSGSLWTLAGHARGPRERRPPRAGDGRPGSPTSARTPTASSCSRRRPARSTARCRAGSG